MNRFALLTSRSQVRRGQAPLPAFRIPSAFGLRTSDFSPRRLFLATALFVCLAPAPSPAAVGDPYSIVNSKHNLSISGPGDSPRRDRGRHLHLLSCPAQQRNPDSPLEPGRLARHLHPVHQHHAESHCGPAHGLFQALPELPRWHHCARHGPQPLHAHPDAQWHRPYSGRDRPALAPTSRAITRFPLRTTTLWSLPMASCAIP